MKASLDTPLSSGFRTTPSVSLKTGSRPAKGEQHANEYTRVRGQKSGNSYLLEGTQVFFQSCLDCGEVQKVPGVRLSGIK